MKNYGLLQKTIAVVASAALISASLIGCGSDGDDGTKVIGEQVTEQEWKDGIDTLRKAQNYTETVEVIEDGVGGDFATAAGTYKFDLKNGVACWQCEDKGNVIDPTIFLIIDDGYYYHVENYFISDGESYNRDWYVAEDSRRIESDQFKYACEFYWSGFYNLEVWFYYTAAGYGDDSLYNKFDKCVYDGNSGAYVYEMDYDAVVYSIDYKFKDKRLVAGEFGIRGNIDGKEKKFRASMVCSDFGTTVIDVPKEVTAAIEEYKSAHNTTSD